MKLHKVAGGFFKNQTGQLEEGICLGRRFDLLKQTINAAWFGDKFDFPALKKNGALDRFAFAAATTLTVITARAATFSGRAFIAEGAIARFVGMFTRWSATEAFSFRPLAFPSGISFIAVEARAAVAGSVIIPVRGSEGDFTRWSGLLDP